MSAINDPQISLPARASAGRSADLLMLAGRVLIAWIFLSSGLDKAFEFSGTAAFFGKLGLPVPPATVAFVVLVEVGGGLALLLGAFLRPASIVLALYCIATGLIAHTNFAERMQLINFNKNLAMSGGLLFVAVAGAGAYSIDEAMRRRRVGRTSM